MAVTAILDTSVVTRLAQPAIRERLAADAANGRIGRTTITDMEIGFSARSGPEWEASAAALAVFPCVDVEPSDLRVALDMQRRLAESGRRGRKIPDLLIAAAAQRLRLPVLHYDRDFDLIASVTGQQCHWVVPAGSID